MDIIQHAGIMYFTKGNDIVPLNMKSMMIGNEQSPTVQRAKELIADGYEVALDDGTEKSKPIRQKIMDFNKGVRSMGIDTTDSLGTRILNTVGKLGGKLPGVLGILDIMGMKKEYDQIMAGEHPMFQEAKPITLKDGGYVTNPFVENIFEN
jgi:hypothetical protein